ncbi:MAG: amidohydrolase family protein [bacterium]|nr:amidohydrolase family protein [bacterium]
MLIDFHTHTFPEKIAARTIEILLSNIVKMGMAEAVAYNDATVPGLIKSMDEYGVDYSVVMPIATTTRQSVTINNVAAETNSMDRLFSFGSLHPLQEDWESTLYDIKEKGLLGIKLHPEYQQFFIDSKESVRVLRLCEKLGLLVTLHTGQDVGMAKPVHCMPAALRRVLDYEVEGSNIIAAHMGGWREWDGVEKYLSGTPIMLDTAYVSKDLPKAQFERIVREHGADKILYATDSPWERPDMTLEYINSTSLTESEKKMIFSENAKKLLKIS